MASRTVLIEVFAVRETRQWRLAPSTQICRHQIEVFHATVVDVVCEPDCDGDCQPQRAVCGRVATPLALQGDNSVTPSADSSRGKENAA
jgi:hypothetical protein